MLYLSRKVGESVMIDECIEVYVEEVRGKVVKLGFNFPETVSILRREVFDRIEAENQQAALLSQETLNELSGECHDER